MNQPLDTTSLLYVAKWGVNSLEAIAKERSKKEDLGPAKPRTYPTYKALVNHWDGSMNKLDEYVKRAPRKKKLYRSHIQAEETDLEAGDKFMATIKQPLDKLREACDKIGDKNEKVWEQFVDLEDAIEKEAKLITKASKMPKPFDMKGLREICSDLISAADEAAEYKEDIKLRDPYENHYISMAEAAAALGWVVAPASIKHMTDYQRIVSIYTENILASFIELGCDPIHAEFSEALKELMDAMTEYVNTEHPAGLKWNYAKGAVIEGYRQARALKVEGSHIFADFLDIMDTELEEYMYYSEILGGRVKEQAKRVREVFETEYKLIQQAQTKQRPKTFAEMKMLFMQTMHELASVLTVEQQAKESDPQKAHLLLVNEAIGIMTWPLVGDESSPLGYCVDIEQGFKTFADKFASTYTKKSPFMPSQRGHEEHAQTLQSILQSQTGRGGEFHLRWCQSLKNLVYAMKLYVHIHHEHEMEFGLNKSAADAVEFLKKKNVSYQLNSLKKKNMPKRKKHWEVFEKKGPFYGKRKAGNAA